jgi:hypothetical protein
MVAPDPDEVTSTYAAPAVAPVTVVEPTETVVEPAPPPKPATRKPATGKPAPTKPKQPTKPKPRSQKPPATS